MRTSFRCPCAVDAVFLPVLLTGRLHAHQCEQCESHLLSLDEYRGWQKRYASPSGETRGGVTDTPLQSSPPLMPEQVRKCPACSRLMARYRTGGAGDEPGFRLDRCGTCQLVWLDKGEWSWLVQEGLSGRLDEILTDEWQLRLQVRENRLRRDAQLRQRLGDETFEALQRIRAWLAGQPNRAELLGLLGSSE